MIYGDTLYATDPVAGEVRSWAIKHDGKESLCTVECRTSPPMVSAWLAEAESRSFFYICGKEVPSQTSLAWCKEIFTSESLVFGSLS